MVAPFTLGRQDIIKQNLLIKTSKHVIFIVKIVGKINKRRALKPLLSLSLFSDLTSSIANINMVYMINDKLFAYVGLVFFPVLFIDNGKLETEMSQFIFFYLFSISIKFCKDSKRWV